jgi:hypothetical protein
MGFLDAHDYVSGYDDRSMEDMKLFHEDGVIVDEIFIDPITFGPSLHVYYSTDDEPHWDNKLWTPIPRNYTLKKGYIALPSPIFARFIKLEFSSAEDVVQQIQENEIQFFGTTMWRSNLLDLLDSSRALSRYVEQSFISDESISLTAEVAPPALDAPDTQSVPDLTEVRLAKERPTMFFPRRCRHEYQIVRSTRPTKIAYFVAIRDVSFHRRDFTVQYDEPVYFESLSDNAHTTINEFARVDWRQVVTP